MTTIFQAEEKNIFKEGKEVSKEVMSVNDFAVEAAFRKDTKEEPNWDGMLLKAKDQFARQTVREARTLYQQEQKYQAHLEEQKAHEDVVIATLDVPQHKRTKGFYEDLQNNNSRIYWSVPVQRQKAVDRKTLGLGFYLKG